MKIEGGVRIEVVSIEEFFDYICTLFVVHQSYLMSLCVVLFWGIWKERNHKLFQGVNGTRNIVLFRSILCSF